jgi:hypothetical protein
MEASELFSSAVKDGFEPNDINIKALFSRVDEHGEGEVAGACLRVYLPLLNDLQECGKIALAASVWDVMLEKDLFRWIECASAREAIIQSAA